MSFIGGRSFRLAALARIGMVRRVGGRRIASPGDI